MSNFHNRHTVAMIKVNILANLIMGMKVDLVSPVEVGDNQSVPDASLLVAVRVLEMRVHQQHVSKRSRVGVYVHQICVFQN